MSRSHGGGRAPDAPGEAPGRPTTPADGGGKRAQFEAEAMPHLDAVHGLALRLAGGDDAAADDLVQETFLRAWRAWDDYEPGTNCRAWLMTILRNTFINQFRKRKRRPDPVDFDAVAERSVFESLGGQDPEGAFFDRLVDAEVVAAIDELPDEFRIPLVLSDLQGLSYREIAEAVGIPVGTVKSRLFRARRRLQEKLYSYAREMGYVS